MPGCTRSASRASTVRSDEGGEGTGTWNGEQSVELFKHRVSPKPSTAMNRNIYVNIKEEDVRAVCH
jgi:hypothetical protein